MVIRLGQVVLRRGRMSDGQDCSGRAVGAWHLLGVRAHSQALQPQQPVRQTWRGTLRTRQAHWTRRLQRTPRPSWKDTLAMYGEFCNLNTCCPAPHHMNVRS